MERWRGLEEPQMEAQGCDGVQACQQGGCLVRWPPIKVGGRAQTVDQLVGNDPNLQRQACRLGDQVAMPVAQDQRADPGGGQVIEQVPGTLGLCRHRDGRPWPAILLEDDGHQMMG